MHIIRVYGKNHFGTHGFLISRIRQICYYVSAYSHNRLLFCNFVLPILRSKIRKFFMTNIRKIRRKRVGRCALFEDNRVAQCMDDIVSFCEHAINGDSCIMKSNQLQSSTNVRYPFSAELLSYDVSRLRLFFSFCMHSDVSVNTSDYSAYFWRAVSSLLIMGGISSAARSRWNRRGYVFVLFLFEISVFFLCCCCFSVFVRGEKLSLHQYFSCFWELIGEFRFSPVKFFGNGVFWNTCISDIRLCVEKEMNWTSRIELSLGPFENISLIYAPILFVYGQNSKDFGCRSNNSVQGYFVHFIYL